MDNSFSKGESNENKWKAWIISTTIHVIIVLFVLILPFLRTLETPVGFEGVAISFGLPVKSPKDNDVSGSAISSSTDDVPSTTENIDDKPSTDITETNSEPVDNTEQPEEEESTDTNTEYADSPSNNGEELSDAKESFGSLFSEENQQSGETGDPFGDPDIKSLEGISKAQGSVGQGLDDRGILFEPEIIDESQKTGRVVVHICVDGNGKVISSKYTQRGSTTNDSELVQLAEQSARKYLFSKHDIEKQCGNITINFLIK